ncbi:MAG: agmatinase [Pseudoclavibacter sp.]|nr:agmatinase [Pseudoclavibacter sp.]
MSEPLPHPHLPAELSANAPRVVENGNVGPVNSALVPRFSGPATFALLPQIHEVPRADIAVLGVPWDAGVSFRSGARFGPQGIRQASRLLRPYNPAQDHSPFASVQIADAGDLAVNPFDIREAVQTVERAATQLVRAGTRIVALGGDHTIALPLLRAVADAHGPVSLLHFDAHLDTWDTYFGAEYTHGTPFRRAAEEGIIDPEAISHVGTRGPLYGVKDLEEDRRMGFGVVTSGDVFRHGVEHIVTLLRERVGSRPLYLSLDIDVLDPAHAPGTGTPEAGGLSSIALLEIVRGLAGLNLVGADVVEVAPAYDHADITAVAASHVAYEFTTLMARRIVAEREAAEAEA